MKRGEAMNLRGFKGDEVPLYLKGRRAGKDINRGGKRAKKREGPHIRPSQEPCQ